jgi:hypothetical protein
MKNQKRTITYFSYEENKMVTIPADDPSLGRRITLKELEEEDDYYRRLRESEESTNSEDTKDHKYEH